jgi:hypothetical protein
METGDPASGRPRFTLLELLILPVVAAGFLMGAKVLDPSGVRSVLVAPYYRINYWLPLLGCSTALVTLVFSAGYQARGWRRWALLFLSIPGAAAGGWGLASIYPRAPILWSTYFGSYAPGTFLYFHYAYAVWLPLTGVMTVATLALLNAAPPRLAGLFGRLRLPRKRLVTRGASDLH